MEKELNLLEEKISEIESVLIGSNIDGIRYINGLNREGFILKLAQKNPWMGKEFVLDILMERLSEEDELLFELIEQDYILDNAFQEDSYKEAERKSKKGSN